MELARGERVKMQEILRKNEKISHQRRVDEIFHSFIERLDFVTLGIFRGKNGLKFLGAHRFVRKQELGNGDEVRLITHEDILAALVGSVDNGFDLLQ